MTRVMLALLAMTLAVAGPRGLQAADLAVHVTGATPKAPTKEAQEQLRLKKEALHQPYVDLQAALSKQYGKDPAKWPADKRAECQAAHDAFFEAQTDWFYSIDLKQKDIDDSVRELSQALEEKKAARVAATRDDADLVVEVVGRAKVTDSSWGANGVAAQLALRVLPGGRLDAPALAKSGAAWSDKKSFWMKVSVDSLHEFTAEAPYWLLISNKPGMGWMASYKAAAGQMAEAIGKFGIENADKLAAARKPAP